ncbi:hypothetical protein CPB83DRAFT_780344 [Crepidotus variabilis]|uniref:DnaJ homologue subfamily C member 28 conserved domain-containing protein n=1 Tax=Crepidotus variabilis TaxID=179855 RepID=A0A9P6JW74_9AGAR|nr:hypothetical protein CPB83DRAFT_780344 [Crepidotus variabilis]
MQQLSFNSKTISRSTLVSKGWLLSVHCRFSTWRFISSTTKGKLAPNLSGSAKLFADAAQEESSVPSTSSKLLSLIQQESNWTGDEKVEDTILRMLIDKHKPLRTGKVMSADEKLKQFSPNLSPVDEMVKASNLVAGNAPVVTPKMPLLPTGGSWATEPLLPAIEGHQPWHTTFRSPSHATSSIKFATITPNNPSNSSPTPVDDQTKRIEKEKKRKEVHAARLTKAKESTLDYRLGIISERKYIPRRPNPTSMKGWRNLVEDRIERARQAGLFETVKGRGKPLARSSEEHNPFIAREEFLLNRILQKKNQSSPPWVELQGELETAVRTFRQLLAEAYVRRTVRVLAFDLPDPTLLSRLTLEDIRRHRDKEWIERERSYHETGIREINALVRKYNALAPYSVRRNLYTREAEVGRLPDECAHEILRNIRDRYTLHAVKRPSLNGVQMSTPTIGSAGAGVLIWLKRIIQRLFRLRSSD